MTERSIPLDEISVRGSLHPAVQEIRGAISTDVSTPIGKVPVRGRVVARYECDGSFRGTVSYAVLVRLAARVKRIALVTRLEGKVSSAAEAECSFTASSLRGRFEITNDTVSGYVRVDGDSLAAHGTVHVVGDDGYRVELRPPDESGRYAAIINLFAR